MKVLNYLYYCNLQINPLLIYLLSFWVIEEKKKFHSLIFFVFLCNKNNTCTLKQNLFGLNVISFIFSIYSSAVLIFLA